MTDNNKDNNNKSEISDNENNSQQIKKVSLSEKVLNETQHLANPSKNVPDHELAKYIRDINLELYHMISDKRMPFLKYLISMVIEEALNIEKKQASN